MPIRGLHFGDRFLDGVQLLELQLWHFRRCGRIEWVLELRGGLFFSQHRIIVVHELRRRDVLLLDWHDHGNGMPRGQLLFWRK